MSIEKLTDRVKELMFKKAARKMRCMSCSCQISLQYKLQRQRKRIWGKEIAQGRTEKIIVDNKL